MPFTDMEYELGEKQIAQPYEIDQLVKLNIPVDCGPIQISFMD